MTQQIEKKKKSKKEIQISPELENALNELLIDFDKLQPKVDRVFEIGRLEGLNDKQIGKFVRKKMKEHYSIRTITNVFEEYPEAKQKQNHKKVETISTFDEEEENGNDENEDRENTFNSADVVTTNKDSSFSIKDFRIEEIYEKDINYIITALEHFYAESRKWKTKYEEIKKQADSYLEAINIHGIPTAEEAYRKVVGYKENKKQNKKGVKA
jgi:hypothetical protein